MRPSPILLGVLAVMLLAGAAAAATQAIPEVPGLLGTIAALFGCTETWEAALEARDMLDEVEFAAALEPWTEGGE